MYTKTYPIRFTLQSVDNLLVPCEYINIRRVDNNNLMDVFAYSDAFLSNEVGSF